MAYQPPSGPQQVYFPKSAIRFAEKNAFSAKPMEHAWSINKVQTTPPPPGACTAQIICGMHSSTNDPRVHMTVRYFDKNNNYIDTGHILQIPIPGNPGNGSLGREWRVRPSNSHMGMPPLPESHNRAFMRQQQQNPQNSYRPAPTSAPRGRYPGYEAPLNPLAEEYEPPSPAQGQGGHKPSGMGFGAFRWGR